MNPNLDGFIAEQHHVDTFNIDAATKGSPYRAELVNSRDLNSVDIQIVDGDGNVVAKYQSKYGATPSDTAKLLVVAWALFLCPLPTQQKTFLRRDLTVWQQESPLFRTDRKSI